ncbi:MAG: HD domain-containing phosphohydrolase [Sulfuricella sp.]|nr:HD domain-containing phosphohydrolase [Sulfuricella sp.]
MNLTTDAISNPDPYYIKSVTEFSESREVVSSADIYSSTSIKLVAKGTRIDRSFYDKLAKHKLTASPIDRCLSVRGAVTPYDLALDATRLLDKEPQLARMANALPDKLLLRNGLSQIYLNDTLAFKLTLAREKRPAFYQHSIRIALISLYLGACLNLDRGSLNTLATAAVFHDLGELHIDPALLDAIHPLSPQERQHIYAHPMIGYLILKEFPEYHPHIGRAVLEHHERLDGSGYPRNLKSDKISRLGQILAVAEVAGSLCGRSDQADACARVEIILKLNPGQFCGDLVKYLSAIARQGKSPLTPEAGADLAKIRARLENFSHILDGWNQTYAPYRETQPQDYLAYTHERLASLEKGLFDIGFNSAGVDALTENIEDDPRSLAELDLLVDETGWQLKDVVYEIRRQWPKLETDPDPAALALKTWASQAEQLLG